jgi:NAD-dependent dihydropyrimidine dehydrogenase PreA subunit
MIELVFDDRCTRCGICVEVCPTNVFDEDESGLPVIARQSDCQTCFMCELYCPPDALFVHPNCDGPVAVDAAAIEHSPDLGQYRRDSGWGRYRGQIPNDSWRMDNVFAIARGDPLPVPPRRDD